jgi:hypothetical protein
MAANVGGGIGFGGKYTTAGVYTDFGFIKGMKDNGTSDDYGGYLSFLTRPNGGSFTERIRITSGGNVSIGNTQANSKFTVSEYTTGNPTRELNINTDTAGLIRLFAYNRNAGGITLALNDPGGSVLIGKIADNFTTLGAKFSGGEQFNTITSGANTYHLYDSTNSIFRFYVTGGGTINAANTTISAISDVRLKENITDLEIGLDAIMALRPRKFDWKKESGNSGKNIRGFIAQEFEQIFPDLIDESINPSPEGEEPYKQIRQDLIPILVKAIQEQQAQIEELKAMIAAK